MATNARRQNRIDHRTPKYNPRVEYIPLGLDANDAYHIFQRESETIHIVHSDGSRGRRHVPRDKSLDDYMAAVADAHGWQKRRYGSLADLAAERIDA